MRGERLAVALEPDDRLHLRLGHVAVHPDAVLAAEGHAGADELVGAVVRDRGRHREADLFGSELPARERLAHVGFARLPRRRAELLDVLLHGRGENVHEPGDRFEEGAVGDHRRDDRAHTDLGGADLADRVTVDQHVRRLRAVGADIEQDAAADDADYRRAQRRAFASWIARQTRSGVTGMSRWRTPSGASASLTALSSAGSAPTVPASPTPLAPSGFTFVGTSWASTSNVGMSSARGIA